MPAESSLNESLQSNFHVYSGIEHAKKNLLVQNVSICSYDTGFTFVDYRGYHQLFQ